LAEGYGVVYMVNISKPCGSSAAVHQKTTHFVRQVLGKLKKNWFWINTEIALVLRKHKIYNAILV
jgi:hypothetical protein